MMSTWSYCHKPLPSTLSAECFSYTSRLKWCLQELLPKPVPSMLYTGCFSYTSRLKWCLHQTSPTKPCPELSLWDVPLTHPGSNGAYGELSQTHAHYNIYWMFLLHIQAKTVHTLNYSHKPMPSTIFESMFLLHMHAEMVPTGTPPTNPYPVCSHYGTFLLKIQTKMEPSGNSFHKPTPSTLPRECLLYMSKAKIGLTRNFTANSSHKSFPVCSLWDVSLTHPG